MANGNHKLAVLIDADNAQASVIQELLAEVSRYGTATIKRAYGDWTTTNLKSWKEVLHTMAIQPVQQFSYTTGKNSTDASLIIDAMDVLHDHKVDGFCLVSSDSDFTRLPTRIREAGLVVYGFGERKTPVPFVAARDKFVYTEILRPSPTPEKSPECLELPTLRPMVVAAIEAVAREDGWAALGPIGSPTSTQQSIDVIKRLLTAISNIPGAQHQPAAHQVCECGAAEPGRNASITRLHCCVMKLVRVSCSAH